ncbi:MULTISPECIES: hypothetical protein [Candidatus Ichthyocystis]|uniref:Uncharacterized protein n=1 Tax=Candidatus Ichthyocystis hellenicum TaxID=1561003 RepID=A0A0S4M3R5_9BURK|nr:MULTISPECIES: hypothetical protein [Ichthyocystis]CUT18273.1 hypothetical protein Ark11_1475 [Candidatus Ichthyocystis hellenicum]
MYTRCSSNGFSTSVIGEKNNVKSKLVEIVTNHISCKNQYPDSNKSFVSKDYLSQHLLNFGTHEELYQDDNYQEKLLTPDIFKLTKPDESNLSFRTYSSGTEETSTSSAIKRTFIEDKSLSKSPTSRMLCFDQYMDNKNVIKKNIVLNSYTRSTLWHKKSNSMMVYLDVIKKIDIDPNGLLRNSVLEKMSNNIKKKYLVKSVDISATYSNIRKYALDRVSSMINEDIAGLDITITPGMSISDLRSSCISNNNFFRKLQECCEKITENIKLAPENFLSHIFQSCVIVHVDNLLDPTNNKIKLYHKKDELIPKLKELILNTISNLPNSIICEIEKLDQNNIVNSLFSKIHGVLVSKSLIKNLILFFNSNKNIFINIKFADNLNQFNELLDKIVNIVRTYCIFHEGVFLPDESTSKQLSRYLLSDMCGLSTNFHKKFKLSVQNVSAFQESVDNIRLESNYTNNSVTNESAKKEPDVTNTELILCQKSKRNSVFAPSLNIYELAASTIDINKGDFDESFMDNLKRYPLMKEYFNKKEKVNIDLSTTHSHVKNYISETLYDFVKKIEKKIEPLPGMTIEELRLAHISNEEFFDKLHKFCFEVINSIKNCSDTMLIDLMQRNVYLETETEAEAVKVVKINKKIKISFREQIENLLIRNISNASEIIVSAIKLIPDSKIIEGYFSHFHNIYIYNKSLLRLKSAFNFVQEKVINDHLLIELADKISLKMINKMGGKSIIKGHVVRKIVNNNIICGKLSTYNYIRKLVGEELCIPKAGLSDHIIVVNNNKIEIADKKTRDEIFGGIRSDLIAKTVKSYNDLCIEIYKSRIRNKKLY